MKTNGEWGLCIRTSQLLPTSGRQAGQKWLCTVEICALPSSHHPLGAKIVEANNGMWCGEAEKYLLANAKAI